MAVDNGLIDALGGEDAAVAWLVSTAGLPEGIKVVDETPSPPIDDRYGGLLGSITGSVAAKLGWQSPRMVDGMLALWQP